MGGKDGRTCSEQVAGVDACGLLRIRCVRGASLLAYKGRRDVSSSPARAQCLSSSAHFLTSCG